MLTAVSLGTGWPWPTCSPHPAVGLLGIWWAVPIGWGLADLIGLGFWLRRKRAAPAL